MPANDVLVLALPKGRILKEVMPMVRRAGIEPEPAFETGPVGLVGTLTVNVDSD